MASPYVHRPTHRALLSLSRPLLPQSRLISTRPSQRAEQGSPPPLRRPYNNRPPPPSSSSTSTTDPFAGLAQLTSRLARSTPTTRARTLRDLSKSTHRQDLERQSPRRWQQGDIYSPHDLSSTEAAKRKKPPQVTKDVFDILGINPLDEYKNVAMMHEFCGPSGRIKGRRESGLRSVNQRRVAKAVRRCVGLGLLPSVHAHPEIVERERRENSKRWFGERGVGGLLTRGGGGMALEGR